MISFFPVSIWGLTALVVALYCLSYVLISTKKISKSHTETHHKYMAALKQIFDLTVENEELREKYKQVTEKEKTDDNRTH